MRRELRTTVLLLVVTAACTAQTTNWQGATGNWNNAGNWDNGVPLTPGFTAAINAAGETVTLDVSPTIDSLQLTAGTLTSGTQVLTLAPPITATPLLTMDAATLNVNYDSAPGAALRLNISGAPGGSTFTATGTGNSIINVNSGQISVIDGGAGNTLSLTGGGTINLSLDGSAPANGVIAGSSGTETLATDFLIQGQGSIQNLALNLSGTVDSNTGGVLTLMPSAAGLINSGTLQASNGSLTLDANTLGGAVNNSGAINAIFGTVYLNAMDGPAASLTNTAAGSVNIGDGQSMYINASGPSTIVQNDGSFNLNSSGSTATLNLNSSGALASIGFNGTGAINLTDSSGNQILGASGAETLVNGAGHTIQGAGLIGNLAVVNNGTINAGSYGGNTYFNGLSMAATPAGFTNNGTMNVNAPGMSIDTTRGNIANTSTGIVNVAGGATLTIASGGLGGTIENDGAINLNYDAGSGATGNLSFDSYSATFTLSGTGSLTMAGQGQGASISAVTGSETLINGASHTLNAAGSMTGLSFINNGTVDVTGVNTGFQVSNSDFINNGNVAIHGLGMTYNATFINEFDNESTIGVTSSQLTLANSFDSDGVYILNRGTIALTDSQLTLANTAGDFSIYEFAGRGTITLGTAGGAGSSIVGAGSFGGDILLLNDQRQIIQGMGVIGNVLPSGDQPTFELDNEGRLIASGGALTVANLVNYDPDVHSLTGGSYASNAGSPLIIQNLGPISTIGAGTSVTLKGTGSMLTPDGTTDALTSLSELDGSLKISGGRSLTLSGVSTFTNTGTLRVGAGSLFDATAAKFQSLDTDGSLSGNYVLAGKFQYTPQTGSNGFVLNNNGNITLKGAESLMTFDGTTDALQHLTNNYGGLTLSGGRMLTLSGVGTFTNNGALEVGAGSVLNTGGAALGSLDVNGKLSGQYTLGGEFLYAPQAGGSGYVSTISSGAGVTLTGPGSLMTFDGSTDALSRLTTNNGSLTIGGGRFLTLSGISTFTNNGFLEVDAGSELDTHVAAFQNLDATGNLTGNYQIGGTLWFTPQSGSNGKIKSIDQSASLLLSGAGEIVYGALGNNNALSKLSVNNGAFGLTAGASLSLSGGYKNGFSGYTQVDSGSAFTISGLMKNNGQVVVSDAGTILTAQGYAGSGSSQFAVLNGATAALRTGSNGGFQNLINNGGSGTLIDGLFVVGGTLKIDGVDNGAGGTLGIGTIDSSAALTLTGSGQILYGPGSGTNALAQLSTNNGVLALANGATLIIPAFTNAGGGSVDGLFIDGIGSNLTVNCAFDNAPHAVTKLTNGGMMQVNGPVTTAGRIALDGFNTKFVGQGLTVAASGSIRLSNGATLDVRTPGGGFNTFTNLGGGTLTAGVVLTGGVLNGGTYILDGNFLYDPTTDGTAGAILAIGADTQITLLPGGQVLTGGGDGTNALTTLQENDGEFTLLGSTFGIVPASGTMENSSSGSMLLESGGLFVNGNMQNDGIFSMDFTSNLVMSGTFTQSGGTSTVDGILVTGGQISLTGGLLNGTGLLAGDVTQTGGTIQPGDAPGVLNIDGNYTLTAGTLDIDFVGRDIPGIDWSQLFVGGTADLGGDIEIDLSRSIGFQAGDVFEIIGASAVIDDGVRFDLPSLGPGLAFVPVFVNGNELDLDVQVTPEPSGALLFGGALAALLLTRRKLQTRRKHQM